MNWLEKYKEDLQDFQKALDAMDDKRLCRDKYVDHENLCCGNGALAVYRGVTLQTLRYLEADDDVTFEIGISHDLHDAIVRANNKYDDETPEQRWQRMRNWVDEQLQEVA